MSIMFWSLFLNKNRILLSLSIDGHRISKIKLSSYLQHLGISKEFTKESIATEVSDLKKYTHTQFSLA